MLKILDFGVARLVEKKAEGPDDPTATHTAPGSAVGSPPYMAPEQVLGKDVDTRTDLYAAGAVLYELATWRRPFGELRGGDLADAILHRDPERPSAVNASVPPSLEAVILKALEKDPALRHQTAGDLLADLERLARDDTAGGPPATAPVAKGAGGPPVSSRTRRLPWPRIAASVAVVGLAAGAWLLRSPPPPRILGGRAIAEASARAPALPGPLTAIDSTTRRSRGVRDASSRCRSPVDSRSRSPSPIGRRRFWTTCASGPPYSCRVGGPPTPLPPTALRCGSSPGGNTTWRFRVRWSGRSEWEDVDLPELIYPDWTRDGRAIVGLRPRPWRIERFTLATRERRVLVDLADIPLVIWVGVPWMGLAADDSPLVLLDRGTRDFYAFEWEAP